MRLSRRNSVDVNQAAIVKVLRAAGATVYCAGKPVDLIVGYRGCNFLVEVKNPEGGRTTGEQAEFFASWRGQVAIVRTEAEALAVIGIKPKGEVAA